MRWRFAFLVVMALCAGMASFLPASFAAETSKAKTDAGADYDPDNRTHISRFMESVAQANAQVEAHDLPGAIESYRKAIQLQPAHPLGHYLLGEALLVQGDLPGAEAALTQADGVGDRMPSIKAKILFVLADIKERQKKWDEAKAVWTRYVEFSASHGDAGVFPTNATARIAAIDDMLKQDKAYEVVRQRIAAEKDAGKK